MTLPYCAGAYLTETVPVAYPAAHHLQMGEEAPAWEELADRARQARGGGVVQGKASRAEAAARLGAGGAGAVEGEVVGAARGAVGPPAAPEAAAGGTGGASGGASTAAGREEAKASGLGKRIASERD